jgi:hypothetical protein
VVAEANQATQLTAATEGLAWQLVVSLLESSAVFAAAAKTSQSDFALAKFD